MFRTDGTVRTGTEEGAMHDNVDNRPEDRVPAPIVSHERWFLVGTNGHGDGAVIGAALELERLRDAA